MEFNGITRRRRPAGRVEPQIRRAARRRWSRRFTRWPAGSSTSARPSNCSRCCSTSRSCPGSSGPKPAAAPTSKCWKSWPGIHPLPAKIIEYRQYAKLKNTYVDALPQLVHPRPAASTRRSIRSVAATGRLSSSDPNLQNIPIRTASGREIRSGVSPRPRRLAAAGGRLFADRAARAGPSFRTTRPAGRLRPRRRHSCPRGQPGLTASRWVAVTSRCGGGQGGEFRRDLRPKPVRPGEAAGDRAGRRRRSSSGPISPAIRASAAF